MTIPNPVDLGHPHSTGDNWQFGVRPSETLDAAEVEIVEGPVQEEAS